MAMSLWLVPREQNPFTTTMQELISDTVPRNFTQQTYNFTTHVLVTSDIYSQKTLGDKSAQEWLDSIELPAFKAEHDEVVLTLDTVEAEDDFYRKMNISVKDDVNLKKLAVVCRQAATSGGEEKAQAWAQQEYRPCFPLLYGDIPTKESQGKVPLIEMKIGFAIGDIFACCGGTLCMGGFLVLVDTSKPIDQWEPIAKRETPWTMWRATHNLI